VLSGAKKNALNRLFEYIPGFRKGQFKKSEGDIRLGDILDNIEAGAPRWRGVLAVAPSNPIDGDIYFNTVSSKVAIYANGGWVDLN